MKRDKVKPQRKGRKAPKGRQSSIAKQTQGADKGRMRTAMSRLFPNSGKVGAGTSIVRRSLSNLILRKRNHRSNEMMGNGEPHKLVTNN